MITKEIIEDLNENQEKIQNILNPSILAGVFPFSIPFSSNILKFPA